MKEITKEVTIYEAEDSTVFISYMECEQYENKLKFETKRLMFLNDEANKLFKEYYLKVDIYCLYSDDSNTDIYIIKENDCEYLEMCDENLDGYIDSDRFDEIVEEFNIKYGFEINVPIYFWSK